MKIPNSQYNYLPVDVRYQMLLDFYGLRQVDQAVRLFNSGAQNPYHGYLHLETVACDVMTIMHAEQFGDEQGIRSILIAAMLHDVMHSGGIDTDPENVARAVDFVDYIDHKVLELHNDTLIKEAIGCTVYSNGFPVKPKTFLERTLRDADLMTIFHVHEDVGMKLMLGLCQEINFANHLNGKPLISLADYVVGQRTFLTGIEWHTTFAQQLANRTLATCLDYLERNLEEFAETN